MDLEPPVEMVVDRPFLFAITDLQTRLPLFLGRVTDPAAG
jgi:serpin B